MAVTSGGEDLAFVATLNGDQLTTAIARIESQLGQLTTKVQQSGGEFENLAKKATAALGAYLSFQAGSDFIKSIVTVRGEFQKLEVAFTTMLKSKSASDRLLTEAVQLAAITPFSLTDVATGAKQLLAYGFAASEVTSTLTTLGNIAAGVGAPLNDITYLFGTLRTQGRAYTRDIQQFTARGIPIISELAKVLGIAEDKVLGIVEAGKVGFPEVELAFANLTGQGGLFFNLMEEQSKTLSGLVANLGDAWDSMLNSIGKSNEGVFATALQGAIALVENYQKILDVILVIISAYGAYKAAVAIATTINVLQAGAVNGVTIAEQLRTYATIASEKAMRLLNTAMLTNPAVLIATGIATLTAALIIFSKETTAAERAQNAINEATQEANVAIQKEKDTLGTLLAIAKNEKRSKEERLEAIRKINALNPTYLNGINLENINTVKTNESIKEYINLLGQKARAQAAQGQLDKLYNERAQILLDEQAEKNASFFDKILAAGSASQGDVNYSNQIKAVNKANTEELLKNKDKEIEKIKEVFKTDLEGSLVTNRGKQEAAKRTIDVIDDEIKTKRAAQKAESDNHEAFLKYEKEINKLEKERLAITGASKKDVAAAERTENKSLNERAGLLERIEDLKRDADQSGMLKDQSEVDKINEKYDDLINKVNTYNNNKNRKAAVINTDEIEKLRARETNNALLKDQAEQYRRNLDVQQDIFSRYEDAKVEIGRSAARELYGAQIGEFDSYADFLQNEIAPLVEKSLTGELNVADQQKKVDIAKKIADETIRQQDRATQKQFDDYTDLLQRTEGFNAAKLRLETKYEQDLANLRKLFKGTDLAEREKELKRSYDNDTDQLNKSLIEQSDLYKKLNQDIMGFTRTRAKDQIKEFKSILQDGFFLDNKGGKVALTPELIQAIQKAIEALQAAQKKTDPLNKALFEDIGDYAGRAANALYEVADAVQSINGNMADSLRNTAAFADLIGKGAGAGVAFASGDIAGGVSGSISYISGIVKLLTDAKKSQIDVQNQMLAFQDRIIFGELEINAIIRQRQREQAGANESTLLGIKSQTSALKDQRKQIESEYQSVLDKLYKESYVKSEEAKKKNLFSGILGFTPYGGAANLLGIGQGSTLQQNLSSLYGKTYDELEKLFKSGQLTDKAKELFQQLEKLKQEGADIDKLLEENKAKVQELYTGTTADSIIDAIAEGFNNGLRSAEDFANTFEDLMKDAALNALKFQYLETPLKEFYAEFAKQSEGGLTEEKIKNLKNLFSAIITDAGKQFDDLQKITNLDFNGATGLGSTANSLSGSIRQISEQTGDIIAGNLGGMRVSLLALVDFASRGLIEQQKQTAYQSVLPELNDRMRRWELSNFKVTM